MTSNSGAALVKKGHPIRGILWGIMFGLGLTIVLIVTKVISLELSQMIIVLIAGIAVGVLWSLFGPAKAPKGPAPVASVGVATDAPLEPADDESAIGDGESASDSEDGDTAGSREESPEIVTDEPAIGNGDGVSGSDDSDDGEWRSNS